MHKKSRYKKIRQDATKLIAFAVKKITKTFSALVLSVFRFKFCWQADCILHSCLPGWCCYRGDKLRTHHRYIIGSCQELFLRENACSLVLLQGCLSLVVKVYF